MKTLFIHLLEERRISMYVVTAGGVDGISPETVMLAASLMAKHGKAANERMENRLNSQK